MDIRGGTCREPEACEKGQKAAPCWVGDVFRRLARSFRGSSSFCWARDKLSYGKIDCIGLLAREYYGTCIAPRGFPLRLVGNPLSLESQHSRVPHSVRSYMAFFAPPSVGTFGVAFPHFDRHAHTLRGVLPDAIHMAVLRLPSERRFVG